MVPNSQQRDRTTHPLDKDIRRNRAARLWVLVGSIVVAASVGAGIGMVFGSSITGSSDSEAAKFLMSMMTLLGTGAGLTLVAVNLEGSFILRNGTTQLFVTIDQFASLLGQSENVHVPYGPGMHLTFPWEDRQSIGEISLTAEAFEFDFAAQCKDATLFGKCVVAIRPDIQNPVPFLTGLTTVQSAITGFFKRALSEELSQMQASTAIKSVVLLNEKLKARFNDSSTQTPLFQYGIVLDSVSVFQLLPSAKVQRTMSALLEAEVVFEGTAALMGYSPHEAKRLLETGQIETRKWNEARDRFLSISGNLKGIKITRYEFELERLGLEKAIAEALAKILRDRDIQ